MKTFNIRLRKPIAAFSTAMAVLGATAIAAAPAQAFAPVTIGFDCVTTAATAAAACDAGENQFKARIEAVAGNPNQVLFRFMNTIRSNSVVSSITSVLFEDTGLRSLAGLDQQNYDNVGAVDFVNRSSNTLPGAPSFLATFGSRSNPKAPGVVDNGINLGEELGILMSISSGFANPIDAVITDLQNGGLRLGLQASGFSGSTAGFKVSYVNSAVPEPLTMLGTGAALGLGALMKRRQAALQKKAG